MTKRETTNPTTSAVTVSGGRSFTVRRPTWREFQTIARGVSVLSSISPEAMLDDTEKIESLGNRTPAEMLEHIIRLLASGPVDELFEAGEFSDVIQVWEAILNVGGYESFFASKDQKRFESRMRSVEREVAEQVAQIRVFQREGLLPEQFDMQSLLQEAMKSEGLNLVDTLASSTSTPESTDGPSGTASTPTTSS